jgi:SAM-dependent methyltransferase
MDEFHDDRHRAESFGAAAEAYDRHRPSYPGELVDFLTPEAPGVALDIGCGTGQLSRLLQRAGWTVTRVELDARMAAVAASHGVAVEVTSFEDFTPPDRFDLITAAQSWHWIVPETGFAKAAELLRPGGRLALVWTTYHYGDDVGAAFGRAFGELAPELLVESGHLGTLSSRRFIGRAAADFPDVTFGPVETQVFQHHRDQSVEQWIAEARTHSPIATLPDQRRTALLDTVASELRAVLEGEPLGITHQARLVTAVRA